MRLLLAVSALSVVLLGPVACSSSTPRAATDASAPTVGDFDPVPFGGNRPAQLYVPSSYTGAPTPLLVLLHGYSASGLLEDLYLNLKASAEAHGMLYIHPDGQIDSKGNRYWNATDACCDFDHSNVDDSAYVAGLIAEIGTRYAVDPKRVFLLGHSNGAFMSYRMACDHADVIAGIVSIAGATFQDTTKCHPSGPVAVLQVHGTADKEVIYGGSTTAGDVYPGAAQTVTDWATYDGCATTPDTSSPNLDLDDQLAGAETTVSKFTSGCAKNGQVELWSIQGGSHIPSFSAAFDPDALDWLLAHPKP